MLSTQEVTDIVDDEELDVARRGLELIKSFEEDAHPGVAGPEVYLFTAPESTVLPNRQNCTKPVIVAIHSHCFTCGVDFALAGDIRLASRDAKFAILVSRPRRVRRRTRRGSLRRRTWDSPTLTADSGDWRRCHNSN